MFHDLHRGAVARRTMLALPLAGLGLTSGLGRLGLASGVSRELIAAIERVPGLTPPLTLGIARVMLQPGAAAPAVIPGGARLLAVESGVLAVSVTAAAREPLTARDFSLGSPAPAASDELFVPAGTAIAFAARGVTSMRNPGDRSTVVLDAAVFREAPRSMARAFTTEDGVSFQLLASASAQEAPAPRATIVLEHIRLGHQATLPEDLSGGVTLLRVESGMTRVRSQSGAVLVASSAASAPYATSESLQPLASGSVRDVTAGGVVFLPAAGSMSLTNPSRRIAGMMALALLETA
jgi:hypothetical protein